MMLLPLALLWVAEPTTIWVQIPNPPKYPESTTLESRGLLFTSIQKVLEPKLTEIGYAPALVLDEGSTPKPGSERSSDGLILRLEKWNHRNRSNQDILNSPNGPKSETTLELRLWQVQKGKVGEETKLKSKVGGPYFGTTDRTNMSGSPEAKSLAIRLVNRQRMDVLAAATWEAVRFHFPVQTSRTEIDFFTPAKALQQTARATS